MTSLRGGAGRSTSFDASKPDLDGGASAAEAELAAAHRRALDEEDAEAWGDDSDDDTFAEREAAQSRLREQSAGAGPSTTIGGGPSPAGASGGGGGRGELKRLGSGPRSSVEGLGPSPTIATKPRQVSLSGSGKGFWDIPAAAAANGQRPSPRTALAPLPASSGPLGPMVNTREGMGSKAPELQRHKSPAPEAVCKRSIRDDVQELMEDPAHALERLKISMDADELARSTPPATATVAPLPWEAVLPPELVSPPVRDSALPDSEPASPVDPSRPPVESPAPPSLPPPASIGIASDKNAAILQDKHRRRLKQFCECLSASSVDISQLRKLAWQGIPETLRPVTWQLLLGYLPAPAERRKPVLKRKRQEYADAVRAAFARGDAGLDSAIWHQIRIDIPRTNPGIPLWQSAATQRSLERILYVWAIRHPASGYVQGINDLVTPFFQVFLSSYIDTDPEAFDVSTLPCETLQAIEADSFWSLSKLLDGIQDNYTFAQPGIQRQVARMKELCKRVDAPLYRHLEEQSVEFIQFAFRWMNCLLMRELSTKNIIRMWDTYLAEGTSAFSEFHLYVCIAFLVRWSEQLRSMDFQAIIIFLQALPTQDWSEKNTELLLSEAFMWSSLFHNASGHFERK